MPQQSASNYHPVLPKQSDDSRVGQFNKAGEWVRREASELENLSDSLKVEKIKFEVNSIPDMWARPLLFEMALFDKGHQLHEQTVGEWRGLLAMLALREHMNLDLSGKLVEIPQNAGETKAGNNPAPFLAALSKLIPQKTLAPDTTWRRLHVLLFKRKPIAITSPTTLVCTATNYFGHTSSVPWSDGKYLLDPIDYLADNMREDLKGWLIKLSENLLAHDGYDTNSGDWNRLTSLINDFMEDLNVDVKDEAKLSGARLELGTGLFSYIASPLEAKEHDPDQSHVRLIPSREKPPSKSILVLDDAIADQWRMRKQDISFLGRFSLETMPFSGLSDIQNNIPGLDPAKVEIWEPKNFFTEKLFVITQKDAFPGAVKFRMSPPGVTLRIRNDEITPILPINQQLLKYLNPEDISQRLKFEGNDEVIVVKLRLPLAGPDGKGKDFEISRAYSRKNNEVKPLTNTPVVEIWPNFKVMDENWKAYYTYYYAPSEEETFDAQPFAYGNEDKDKQTQNFLPSQDGSKRRITRINLFPEAMICKAKVADPQTDRMETYEAGVILINQPRPQPRGKGSMKVGVDFGAANTNVYFKQDNSEPAPVVFEDRCLQITESLVERTNLFKDFLSGNIDTPPFLSVYRDFFNPENPTSLRAILDGRIYYFSTFDDLDVNSSGFVAGLKWSRNPEDRLRTKSFLEQICLQVAAEAISKGVDKISWAYSYPTAFSHAMRTHFSGIWGQIIESCAALTGFKFDEQSLNHQTESVAAAIFFNLHPELRAPLATGTVCMDIGGSTTDIAIWQEHQLLWQASLRIAGRDMFSNFLHARPEFLRRFHVDVKKLAAERQTGNFHTIVDAMLNKGVGEKWLESLPVVGGEEEVMMFTRLIAIGLAGVFYYIGQVLKYLESNKIYKKSIPDIFVGGNASRLFHWLGGGKFSRTAPINSLFKQILLHSSDFGSTDHNFKIDNFRIEISPAPKAEAAYGLVQQTNLRIEAKDDKDEVIAGETFLENGESRDWHETMRQDSLHKGVDAPENLDRIHDFLAAFNKYAGSETTRIEQVPRLVQDVRKRLADDLKNFTGFEDPSAIPVEPVFILALKNLLEIKTGDWASSVKIAN